MYIHTYIHICDYAQVLQHSSTATPHMLYPVWSAEDPPRGSAVKFEGPHVNAHLGRLKFTLVSTLGHGAFKLHIKRVCLKTFLYTVGSCLSDQDCSS